MHSLDLLCRPGHIRTYIPMISTFTCSDGQLQLVEWFVMNSLYGSLLYKFYNDEIAFHKGFILPTVCGNYNV